MENGYDIIKILGKLNPAELTYQEWLNVGMALEHEGYSVEVWNGWSKNDSRYHEGECQKKWRSFHGHASPVTAGTIIQLAKDHGLATELCGYELGWDDVIEKDSHVVVDQNWIEDCEIKSPGDDWNPAAQLVRYLETLFEAGENVGYVTESWEKTDEKGTRWLPKSGHWDRTAGQLIEELNHCKGDIGAVLGDYNSSAGAWIRFNPVDGKGCKNENVTEFRYALVESDEVEVSRQNALIRGLELPVACLVHSGKKSLHAIVRVDAADYAEYRKRVDYLYNICQKNGLKVDTQNRNPSRLSRMPGVERNGQKQFLVDTNIGKKSWAEWYEWIEGINDDLPDPEGLESVWDNMPELSPPLIEGVLRQGHKMLIAGPSKAGKSFLQIELCISIAEGHKWLKWACAQGRVLYVNLELDPASCLHRFRDVYQAMGVPPKNLQNIDIWNLRGKSVPMDKLAPKLIRRATRKNYIAVIIDPIYKVITGDENSADQMANFCNQFDLVCTELGCAVIYCHHHSKGAQGNKKSMDRASGSGVFARDPDALLDLIELETTEGLRKQEENKAICKTCERYLDTYGWPEEDISADDLLSSVQVKAYCQRNLDKWRLQQLQKQIEEAVEQAKMRTAWRIEGTLREFPKFNPINLWFDYPIHCLDNVGVLGDIRPEEEKPLWKRAMDKRKSPEQKKSERKSSIETAFDACTMGEKVTVEDLASYLAVTEKTVRNRLKEHGGFIIEDGEVRKKT